jgi:ABC-type nitrate/sulfonate/bicarbonate transport system substrate-binding protein
MRRFRSVFILITFLLTTVAQLSIASAQTKITIGYAAVSPRTTPLYLAQEQGLFAK